MYTHFQQRIFRGLLTSLAAAGLALFPASAQNEQAPTYAPVALSLVGANPGTALLSPDTPQPSGFFLERARDGFHESHDISGFQTGETFQHVYPGISLTHFVDEHHVEFAFALSTGADPSLIRIRVDGATFETSTPDGHIVYKADGYEIYHHAPIIRHVNSDGSISYPLPGSSLLLGETETRVQTATGTDELAEELNFTRFNLVSGAVGGEGPAYDFFMSRFEVTNRQWLRFLNDAQQNPNNERGANMFFDQRGNVWIHPDAQSRRDELFSIDSTRIQYNPDRAPGDRYSNITDDRGRQMYADHPATGISWYGALKYCNWLTLNAGRPLDQRAYREGTNIWDWAPVTATNWTNGLFSFKERQDWLDLQGFRLPMFKLYDPDSPAGTNFFNEFYKAGSWNGLTNTLYGYGRDTTSMTDAGVLSTSLRQGSNLMPVGFFDGINRLPTGLRTEANDNGFGLYDLTGNVSEWVNDPPFGGVPDARLLAGGSFDDPLRPLSEAGMVPPHLSDAAGGFRPVTTYMPESLTFVNILFCFHTTNGVPEELRQRFGIFIDPAPEPEDPDPEAPSPPDAPPTPDEVEPTDVTDEDIEPDIPGILLRDLPPEPTDPPPPGPPGLPGPLDPFDPFPPLPPDPPDPIPTLYQLDLLSRNPASGVSIGVSVPDAFGYTDGTTAFTRFYPAGQQVTLTAPAMVGNNVFQYWARNGVPFSPATVITVEMLSDLSLTAVYLAPQPPPQRRLDISSTPVSGVAIALNVEDNNGLQNGTTTFSRIYDQGQQVSVTAPASANGEPFQGWLRNGQPFSPNQTVTVTLFNDTSLTAQYGQAVQTEERRLTVTSANPNQNVPISISDPDNNGLQDGSTTFNRLYDAGTAVTVTAPPTADGNAFSGWYRNGVLVSTNLSFTVEMSADIILMAQYESPPPDIILTVNSDRPNSGVGIAVTTPDNDGLDDGTTSFTRRYSLGDQTSLTAPQTAPNGNIFRRWLLNGSPITTNNTVSLTLLADAELTAVYRPPDPPPAIYELVVESENPDSGVTIAVSAPDTNNDTDGSTAFSRFYLANTATTLTAPAVAPNGNQFVRWEVDGIPFSSLTQISLVMDANRSVKAIYAEPPPQIQYTLNVESRDPNSLVVVTVNPADVNGQANGTTPFARLYNEGQIVTLTARNPAFPGSSIFLQQWLLDGVPYSTNATIQVEMLSDRTATAVYGPPLTPTNHILSVVSINPGSGVPISISVADIHDESDGTTAFDREYGFGQNVALTAPAQAPNGNRFLHWLYNGVLLTTNLTANVSMIDDHTLTAVYEDLPPIRNLTVRSVNPGAGVNVTVSQPDLNANQNGTTEFQRQYLDGETVSLTTTPLAPNGRDVFARWERDGIPVTTNTTTSVTLFADTVMTAIYEPPRTFNLTVRSQNPDSNVPIAVSTPDVLNRTDGNTTFSRTYDPETTTTLTAPLTAPNGAPFIRWLLNGVPYSTDNQITIEMLSDLELTAVYGDPDPIVRVLVVRSVNPDSGVLISISPDDRTNQGNGETSFRRLYDDGEMVTATAPASVGTNDFRQWILNGSPLTTNLTTTVLMSQDHDLIAVYGPPVEPQQRVLTVDSRDPYSGVPIQVSEPDISGDTDGNTVFVRIYNYGDSTILTAPETAGTNNHAFLYWERDGQQFSNDREVTVDMVTDIRMTAVYGPLVPDVTLTVKSQNPDSGVVITVAPADLNAETTGTTEFQRIYSVGQNVALSAPSLHGGQPFLHWLFDGTPFSTNNVVNITMLSDTTMTAVYGDPEPVTEVRLTVRSEGPDGVMATLLSYVTPDNNGDSTGETTIQRFYDQYETVTLTTPSTSNGLNFSHWSIGNAIFSANRTVTLEMLADTTITAIYVEPPPSPNLL